MYSNSACARSNSALALATLACASFDRRRRPIDIRRRALRVRLRCAYRALLRRDRAASRRRSDLPACSGRTAPSATRIRTAADRSRNSRPPCLTKALSCTASVVMGPSTCGAMPMKLANTSASSVRGYQVVTSTTMQARDQRGGHDRHAHNPSEPFALIRSGVFQHGHLLLDSAEEQQPDREREKQQPYMDRQRSVATAPARNSMRTKNTRTRDGQHNADNATQNPRRKERSQNVERRRAGTSRRRQQQRAHAPAGRNALRPDWSTLAILSSSYGVFA